MRDANRSTGLHLVLGVLGTLGATALAALGCQGGKEPAPVANGSARGSESAKESVVGGASDASADASVNVSEDASMNASADASADASVTASSDAGLDASVALYQADGAPLEQTDAFPTLDSPSYSDRIAKLWNAIVADDPALATDAFFPLVAYAQVKSIPKPAIDYQRRLLTAFARDIHAYHQKLGKDASATVFVRLDVPVAKAKWMEPGTEGNKLGYDRVLDSKLVFGRSDGSEGKLEVKSMISWRGEWYVVHLAGFK